MREPDLSRLLGRSRTGTRPGQPTRTGTRVPVEVTADRDTARHRPVHLCGPWVDAASMEASPRSSGLGIGSEGGMRVDREVDAGEERDELVDADATVGGEVHTLRVHDNGG